LLLVLLVVESTGISRLKIFEKESINELLLLSIITINFLEKFDFHVFVVV